jgi:hypothetical protein
MKMSNCCNLKNWQGVGKDVQLNGECEGVARGAAERVLKFNIIVAVNTQGY